MAAMEVKETSIPGCFEIMPFRQRDERGEFVKTFHEGFYRQHGLSFAAKEEYFSTSKQGVLRGMHFQLPPHHHAKLVYCLAGSILDVLVDLRIDSPQYGVPVTFALDDVERRILFIPAGVAHGFYTLSEWATLVYKTSTVHAPTADAGILWSSFDVWPTRAPNLSPRDQGHPLLKDFTSPFTLEMPPC